MAQAGRNLSMQLAAAARKVDVKNRPALLYKTILKYVFGVVVVAAVATAATTAAAAVVVVVSEDTTLKIFNSNATRWHSPVKPLPNPLPYTTK